MPMHPVSRGRNSTPALTMSYSERMEGTFAAVRLWKHERCNTAYEDSANGAGEGKSHTSQHDIELWLHIKDSTCTHLRCSRN